ncbi:uncharacterized protein LOC134219870 [Armigeres subalbatus]|uniref:uncharacterized protein LOC134219870 n=1 Tax=Armigeres subalbatus TaxID=124917 RepID=UPI002ED18E1C
MEVVCSNTALRDLNIFNTAYYPTDVMLYFEQHHIFEIIFDLMILLDQNRPYDIHEFIASNLKQVADKYRKINITVDCPHNYEKVAMVCARVHDAPIISMKNPVSKKRIRKLLIQLKRFGLDRANLIFIGDQVSTHEQLITNEFHLNKTINLIDLVQNNQLLNTKTILPAACDMKSMIKQLIQHPSHPQVKYIERILIVGRPGSGKHRQAQLLANRLDLILVSASELINTARWDKNLFKKTLEIGLEDNVHTSELMATIVQKRLLEPDCLQFGWVLVDFPNTAEDVGNLNHLLIHPKKVVRLHTNARLCWKRKINHIMKHCAQAEDDKIQLKRSILQAEFDFFDIHQPEVDEKLMRQNCIILDINGNNTVESVHSDILKKLLKA